jgi:hypothetical protein
MVMSPRLLRPRATGFNPKSISGLKLWLDVANTSSLTFNGSTVSQVNDLSGNGFHATQGTANNQPTYQATGANGKPTLFFDTNDIITTTAKISDYVLSPTTSPTLTLIMAAFQPPTASSGTISFGSDNQSNGRMFFSTFFGGVNFFFDVVTASAGGRMGPLSLTASDYTSPVILTAYRHGSQMRFRRNGVDVAAKNDASAVFSATTAALRFPEAAGASMYLSECIAYAAALSSSDISKAERGLGKKWGISVA